MEREILQFLELAGRYFDLPGNAVAAVAARFERRGSEITPAIAPRRRRSDKVPQRTDAAPGLAGQARASLPRWASPRQVAALFL